MNITITLSSQTLQALQNDIISRVKTEIAPKKLGEIKQDLLARAKNVVDEMQSFIKSNARRESTGKLGKAITAEETFSTPTSFGIGIINISKMDQEVPYWYLINYGGTPKFGGNYHFVPGEFNGKIFDYQPGSSEGKMLPSGIHGSVHPMNYIEAGISLMQSEINELIAKFRN